MNLPHPKLVILALSLLPLACSDPPSPPNQGAVIETIIPTPGGMGCNATSGLFAAPPNADSISGTSATLNCDLSGGTGCNPDANIVVDGDNGASVKCTVSGGGDSFNVNASLAQGDLEFTIATSGTPLTSGGGKAFVSSNHAQHGMQDSQCDITIVPNQGRIVSGAIWASYNCPKFGDPTTGTADCTAMGKFIFENCDK